MKFANAREHELAQRVGVEMQNFELLRQSMAHRSWCAENGAVESNERLEFLGDAVLGLVVTNHLYRTYPDFPEGELAKIRAAVVSTASLAEVAQQFSVGSHLLLGKGEDLSGGREKRSILADAVEAIIGAVYIDSGWDAAAPLVMRLVGDRLAEAAVGPGGHDFKTRLQEFSAHEFDRVPRYVIEDHGPDHEKRFVATVVIDGEPRGTGEGPSKKEAEQAAAAVAWKALGATLTPPVRDNADAALQSDADAGDASGTGAEPPAE